MNIGIVGGGPAGLYLATLLRKLPNAPAVTVFERNPPHVTTGWGVVFSDETLSHFEAADAPSHRAITGAFAKWDRIVTVSEGRTVVSTGHGFCGVGRRRLLEILAARAQELGAVIRYGEDVTGPASLCDTFDVVVAADGIRSAVRTHFADAFGPTFDERPNRYIWLGTTLPLDAFTFLFERDARGLFMVHAYRFDAETSTFIVEVDADTFARAGFDRMTVDESIVELERIFAAHLRGHRLQSNRSAWVRFNTVRNRNWAHRNVVLVGDAAHTAHYSIGSGTKLAMEDAIALAEALGSHTGDVATALAAYGTARRDIVERTQRVAQTSLGWFESAHWRQGSLAEPAFTFGLLTRSNRITFENLQRRDPVLVEAAARGFAHAAGLDVPAEQPSPLPAFVPFRLRELEIPNRIVLSPMCMYSAVDGEVNDFHLVHLGARALGGVGLVFSEMTDVSPEGRITPGCAGLWNDAHTRAWRRITDFVHAQSGASIGVQLAHAGRKAACHVPWEEGGAPLPHDTDWDLIAPSALAYDGRSRTPRAMDRADMDRIVRAFEDATRRAVDAGFDVVELHGAHGYLLSQFLSPLSNRRTDAYGGSLAHRLRFPVEVLDAVRAAWPAGRPLAVRISAFDWEDGGMTLDDAVEVSRVFKAHGADVIDVSSGGVTSTGRPVYGRMYQASFSERVRVCAGVPTITVGGISTLDQAHTLLAAGRADLVAIAREHLADPSLTLRGARDARDPRHRWPRPYLMARR